MSNKEKFDELFKEFEEETKNKVNGKNKSLYYCI